MNHLSFISTTSSACACCVSQYRSCIATQDYSVSCCFEGDHDDFLVLLSFSIPQVSTQSGQAKAKEKAGPIGTTTTHPKGTSTLTSGHQRWQRTTVSVTTSTSPPPSTSVCQLEVTDGVYRPFLNGGRRTSVPSSR